MKTILDRLYHHVDNSCGGSFNQVLKELPYTYGNGMPVELTKVMMAVCSQNCASYIIPGYEHALELKKVNELLDCGRPLTRPEARFIRHMGNYRTEELAELMGMSAKDYEESERHGLLDVGALRDALLSARVPL